MKLFASELQYLSELYHRLKSEFSDLAGSTDVTALTEAILRNRELLSRVEQMNGRLFQLSKDWETFREHIEPQSRAEIQVAAASARNQAVELARLCEERAGELEQGRLKLEKALEEVRQGTRYLASVRPAKTNYPKFIDSLG